MLPYLGFWVLSCFLVLLTWGEKVKKRQVYFVTSAVMVFVVLLVGLRNNSVDYYSYLEIYRSAFFENFGFPLFDRLNTSTGNEFIFASIASALNKFNSPFAFFLIIVGAVSVGGKFYCIFRFSPIILVSVFLALSYLILKDFSQIRVAASGSILLCSIPFVVRRQFFSFLLFVVAASGFHIFSILYLSFYFFYPLLKSKSFVWIMLLASLTFGVLGIFEKVIISNSYFLPDIVQGKVLGYYSNEDRVKPEFGGWSMLHLILSFVAISLHTKFLSNENIYYKGFYLSFVFGVCLYFSFLGLPNLPGRALDTFALPSLLILMPCIIVFLKGSKKHAFMIYFLVYSALSFLLHLHLLAELSYSLGALK
jgi:hypothetical protein